MQVWVRRGNDRFGSCGGEARSRFCPRARAAPCSWCSGSFTSSALMCGRCAHRTLYVPAGLPSWTWRCADGVCRALRVLGVSQQRTTPLMYACKSGHLELAQWLVREAGSDARSERDEVCCVMQSRFAALCSAFRTCCDVSQQHRRGSPWVHVVVAATTAAVCRRGCGHDS
jgi:hypothetical protein